MKNIRRPREQSGFALILTISLLALLVLAVYGLSVLVKINGQVATASSYQVQARQHATTGLSQAIGMLQKLAGPDTRVTAMAGIAGEVGGSQRRHWCGVWDSGGAFLGWLTSGATASPQPNLGASDVIQLVSQGTVGTKPATTTAYTDEEYVDVGKVSVITLDSNGGNISRGSYAYWVGDEGEKVSVLVSDSQLPLGGMRIGTSSASTNIARMGVAYQQFDSANAAKVIAYEQSTSLYYASGSHVTVGSLRDSFHHVTLTHLSVSLSGSPFLAGRINLNTTSAVVWRSLIESFELAPGVTKFGTATKRTSAINAIAAGIATSSSGKSAGSPYLSVPAFLNSGLLSSAVTGSTGISVAQFSAVLQPMLAVRSDTFRIRAYGDAVNAVTSTVEATAYCEAIVQRTPEMIDGVLGRKFVITYFRWLGPDDI